MPFNNSKKCLLMRRDLLEQISIFSSEISITTDIAKSMLGIELFDDRNDSTEKFRESIRTFVSTLLEIQLHNVSHIEYLSSVLDESIGVQMKMWELGKIRKFTDKSKKKLYLLSKELTDAFQKLR